MVAHGDAEGEEARPHRLHQEQSLLLRDARKDPRLLGVDGERLLTHHVLPRIERLEGVGKVVRVGGGDVDDVDVGVGDEVGVGAVGFGGGGRADFGEELLGLGDGGGGAGGGDDVFDVVDAAGGGVDDEVFGEDGRDPATA